MTQLQINIVQMLVRAVLMATIGGWLATHGIGNDAVSEVAASAAGLIVIIWGVWSHRKIVQNTHETVALAVNAVPAHADQDTKNQIIADAKDGKF